jgi:2-C-methyl-D-erythritol 4-phosphate cytidylyltransferase
MFRIGPERSTRPDVRVVDYSLNAARQSCDGVILVLPPGWWPDIWEKHADAVAHGGATRSDSVRAGLALVPEESEVVVVHDAARPLATPALFESVIAALETHAGVDGVVPGVPVTDTLKRVEDNTVAGTISRDGLVAVQTPQAFRTHVLRQAHAAGLDATDDAALVEAMGGTVMVVPGEKANIKVTFSEDLVIARALADPDHLLEG